MSLMSQPVATHTLPHPIWSFPRLQIQTGLLPYTASASSTGNYGQT